jgi:hypothetical protein
MNSPEDEHDEGIKKIPRIGGKIESKIDGQKATILTRYIVQLDFHAFR